MSTVTPRAATPTTATVAPIPVPAEAVAAAVETPKAEEALSPKFAALARQQKLFHQERMAFKAEQEAFKAREEEYKTKYIPRDRLKSDFLSVINEEGLSPDEIVHAISNQDPMSMAYKKLEAKLAALEASQNKAVETQAEQQKKAYDQAVNQVRNEVKMLVDSDAAYETIKANDAQDAVVELITETFNKEGKLLTSEEAATQVESYLLEQAVKLAGLEKVKQRLTPKVEAPVKAAPINKPVQTLTHANTTAQTKPLSTKERRERAIAAFRGQQI